MSGIGVRRTIGNATAAAGIGAVIALSSFPSDAESLDARFVLNEMNQDQRVSYVEGIVDGLAYARFLRDRPDETGYLCVINWYQTDSEEKWRLVKKWLARHANKPVPVLMHIMIKKECGE